MVESDDTAMKRYGMKRDVMDRYFAPGLLQRRKRWIRVLHKGLERSRLRDHLHIPYMNGKCIKRPTLRAPWCEM
jgi:hypothetical protein